MYIYTHKMPAHLHLFICIHAHIHAQKYPASAAYTSALTSMTTGDGTPISNQWVKLASLGLVLDSTGNWVRGDCGMDRCVRIWYRAVCHAA